VLVMMMMMSGGRNGECEIAEVCEVKPFWLAENITAYVKRSVEGESQYL
jgi:hypothetical protein